MTPSELLIKIANDPVMQDFATKRNDAMVAQLASVGRTKVISYLAGKGDVIASLGFQVGNAFCDVIDNDPTFRHVKHLLTDGRMDLSLPITQMLLYSFVGQPIADGIVFTAEHQAALMALATVPDPIPVSFVSAVLNGETDA